MPAPIHFLDRSELAFAIDPDAPPRLVVQAPCEVMVETHDARSGKVKRPEDEALTAPVFTDRYPKTNPATGPIRIEGAAPGDGGARGGSVGKAAGGEDEAPDAGAVHRVAVR